MVCSFRGFFFIKTKNHFAVRQLNDDSFVSQFSLRWEWQQFHRTRDRRRQKEDDEKEDARRTRDHRAFLFSQPEHDSDGENDSENSDGGNEYQDADDDDDDYGDDGEGFATRKSVGKHFFIMWEVFGWCLSFFLSFSQNSFFHLLLARYEKRIKNRQNKIVTFYYFLPKQHDDETTRERTLTRFKVSKEKKKKKKKKAAQKRAKKETSRNASARFAETYFSREDAVSSVASASASARAGKLLYNFLFYA